MTAGGWLGLSLRQPWLWAVLYGGKRIENRRWMTYHRGPIILHAAQGCELDEYGEAETWMYIRGLVRRRHTGLTRDNASRAIVPPLESLPRGVFCGVADLVAVLRPGGALVTHSRTERELVEAVDGRIAVHARAYLGASVRFETAWHMPEQNGFLLGKVEERRMVRGRGMPGLFPVPPEVVAAMGLPPSPPGQIAA